MPLTCTSTAIEEEPVRERGTASVLGELIAELPLGLDQAKEETRAVGNSVNGSEVSADRLTGL